MQLKRLAWLRVPRCVGAVALVFAVAGCNTLENGLDATSSASPSPREQRDAVGNVDFRAVPPVDSSANAAGSANQRTQVARASGPWLYPGEEREPPVADFARSRLGPAAGGER